MSPDPRVTVVMPAFNAADFIGEAIASVVRQSFTDWVLMIVDDGSTDDTVRRAQEYAGRDDRVRIMRHPSGGSRGASAARNVAIAAARSEYLAFLDADDVWLPEKLERQVALLDAIPDVGMLYADTTFWFSWTNRPEDAARDHVVPLGVPPGTVVRPPELLRRIVRGTAAVPCTCSVLMRLDVARAVGGFEERFDRVFTDQAFYAKVLLRTPVYVAEGCWDLYRQHPASSVDTAKRAGQLATLRETYLRWLRRLIVETAPEDRDLRRAIARALWIHRHIGIYRIYRRGSAFLRRQWDLLERLAGRDRAASMPHS